MKGGPVMDNGIGANAPHERWQWTFAGFAMLGILLGILRIFGFYLHVLPSLWAWILGFSVAGMVFNWLLNKPKNIQNRIVSQRTKVSPGGTVFKTKPGANASTPPAHSDPWQFASIQPVQTGGAAIASVKPTALAGIGELIHQHKKGLTMFLFGLIGAGFLLGAGWMGYKAGTADVALGYVIAMFVFLAAGGLMLAAAFGKLEGLMRAATGNFAVVWLIFSAICLICFGISAYEGAYIWRWDDWEWVHVAFAVSLLSVFLTGLYLAGLLGTFGGWVGGMLAKAHFGGFLYSISVALWLCWMTAALLFVAVFTKSSLLDRAIEAARAGEFAAIGGLAVAYGVGFFILVAAIIMDCQRHKK